jgi:hypothetical protein
MKNILILLSTLWIIAWGMVSCSQASTPGVPINTSTSIPTPVHSPTAVLISTTSPATFFAATPTTQPAQLPKITRDLLFFNHFGLVLWNHTTSKLEILASTGNYTSTVYANQITQSNDGQRLTFLYPEPHAGWSLGFLDLPNRLLTSLASSEQFYSTKFLTISPDGEWAAFMQPGSKLKNGLENNTRPVSFTIRPQPGGPPGYGVIYAAKTNPPGPNIEIGYCSEKRDAGWRSCMGLLWSPDSGSIAWSDADGMWIKHLGGTTRHLLPFTIGVSPHQGASTIQLRAWSPLGRYILAGIGHHGGWNWAVIDTQTGQFFEFPDMVEDYRHQPSMTWMRDGRLFALKTGDEATGKGPSGQIWRIEQREGLSFIPEREFEIDAFLGNYPLAPYQLDDNRLVMALLCHGSCWVGNVGLFEFEDNSWQIKKLGSLPMAQRIDPTTGPPEMVDWSPDGSAVIYEEKILGDYWLVSLETDEDVNLNDLLGETICCFQWLQSQ